jgi:hypothetical protein
MIFKEVLKTMNRWRSINNKHLYFILTTKYIYLILTTIKQKDPLWLTAGRWDSKYQKYCESSFSWLSNWSLPHALYAQTRVQWLATPLFQPDPLQLASRGWSSPAILPTWDWTENLTVNSPTPTPTKPKVVVIISCQNLFIYPRISQDFKGIQKFKI